MNILVIEDDQQTGDYLVKGLLKEGISAELATKGRRGLSLACTNEYDAIVTDLMLPEMSGNEIIRRLRVADIHTPILVLSARTAVDDRVDSLKDGCDDYMVKPFSFSELVARLEALVRRSSTRTPDYTRDASDEKSITCGEITLDVVRQRVIIDGSDLLLQPKEILLLGYLMRNEARIVSRSMILDSVWGMSFDPQTNVVEAKISRLRSKIAELTPIQWIHTVRGLGYTFERRES